MRPAATPSHAVRILVVGLGPLRVVPSTELAELFASGDLLVVNDAATLPASFFATTEEGAPVELRLVTHHQGAAWTAALFGAGDYRTRTEDRPAPPSVSPGDRLRVDDGLVATVVACHADAPRLVDVELAAPGGRESDVWSALYRAGRPVQYAHVPEPLALWDVQNVYAGRPWAVEMPSAGRALRGDTLVRLRRRGIDLAAVTHAAGLSSIGDPTLDARLPLPERYEVPDATWEAVARTRDRGGRVVAVGTSVVRALEGAARTGKNAGITDLRVGPSTRRLVVDAILTGVHDIETSHFELLGSFVGRPVLDRAIARAEEASLRGHELGDVCLVWGEPQERVGARRSGPARTDEALQQC
jgi:S-adenosylmethionine:tRNA ribosyltransferase-isomerase